MKTLGIIPARSGSKGLKNKNILTFAGKPLIAWTIEAGINSELQDIIVSTDCEKIAELSKSYGADIPFIRPKSLASDTASSADVILHAIEQLSNRGKSYDYVFMLEPTSPLRDASDINRALHQLKSSEHGEAIVGITECRESHPSFIYKKNNLQLLESYSGIHPTSIRRQDINQLYFLEGSIYGSKVKTFLMEKSFYHAKTIGFEMPKEKAIEIDDKFDLIMAESIMNFLRSK